ncbi:L-ascorbate metabolism protein UlaG (beta-lactamase superfamily) [Caulobacter ginsengisoli]|uniref:L-ascorbate metabolism protein UlaG (Beta-lactamase superfamily) n=1 Tax=Caulobacter ginsengisoli TaxID=400775 RepID=A0ABU0INY4_9CAUL|nr:MBL fold metallo-hydrolase [Caulobacter ginsengisoli]MDQ0462677.1 L-ascorbate metabolism protein UlaG (beta-lactamase superfamily) [Caulobacter ginsengisoli]
MKIRYIANACFHITLSTGQTLLTDPWFDGPCQQTWWNFPPVPDALKAQIWASRPDAIYISHLHHDHLHPQTLAPFDRATPVIIGKMNTPNLRAALNVLGFTNLIEVPFETRHAWGAAELVLFKDFHGNTKGDETAVEYDLDTSIYLYDPDGARLFNAVDNTILPADAARIAAEYGVPDIAMLPYASASLYPMAMGDYDDAKKLEAMRAIRTRTTANFRENFKALGPKRVIPAGGEYVLGGPVAELSRYLPQPLEAELAAEVGEALAKLHPGDELDSEILAITREKDAPFRNFTDDQRAAYAMTLADHHPSYVTLNLPRDLPFDWTRALKKCAANYAARREKMGLSIPADIHLDVRDGGGNPLTTFSFSAGDGEGERASLTYQLDRNLLFALITGLLSWNAIEASALMTIRRDPDVYLHDLHRGIVHFTLVS